MYRFRNVLSAVIVFHLFSAMPVWADDEPIQPATWPTAAEQEAEREAEQGRTLEDLSHRATHREGFTAQFAIGVGFQFMNPENFRSIKEVGVAGLNFGFGAFINPSLALLARASNTIVFPNNDIYKTFSMAGSLTAAAQWWPLDLLRLELGAGLGYQFVEIREGTNFRVDQRYGFGLLLAVGVPFWQKGPSSFFVGADYAPLFVEDGPVHCLSISVGWQLL